MEINPSVWAFIGIIGAALLSFLSTRSKYRNDGISTLVKAGVSLIEQYRLSNEECQKKLKECIKRVNLEKVK